MLDNIRKLYRRYIKTRLKAFQLLFLFPCFFLVFQSCETNSHSTFKVPTISGISNIDSGTVVWNSSHHYLIDREDFVVASTLVILEGVVVVFEENARITVNEGGSILAQGLEGKPIIFTSKYDPIYGVKPDSKRAIAGAWDKVLLNSSVSSIFGFCNFFYGGSDDTASTIETINQSHAIIRDCIFANNKGGNPQNPYGALNLVNANSLSKVIHTKFYNNDIPILINPNISLDHTLDFFDPVMGSDNLYNAVFVNTNQQVINRLTWSVSQVAFWIKGDSLIFDENADVLFGNDLTLKFEPGAIAVFKCDTSRIRNSDGPGVVYTITSDDNYKGDTNRDTNQSLPTDNAWKGFYNKEGIKINWTNILHD